MEKRRYPRYRAGKRALLVINTTMDRPFHILDIGHGGVAFKYLGEKKEANLITNISLVDDQHVYLENIPVVAVNDIRLSPDSPEGQAGISAPRRRVSLCFTSLNREQEDRLEEFIREHTVGTA